MGKTCNIFSKKGSFFEKKFPWVVNRISQVIKSQKTLAAFLFDTQGAKMKAGSASSAAIASDCQLTKEKRRRSFRTLQEEEVASNFPYASHTATRATRP
ncbi:MAG: hypothetical protein IJX19_03995 [Clostridia bacterium]|nr:hypothetical protein [Clostridia bacterium]